MSRRYDIDRVGNVAFQCLWGALVVTAILHWDNDDNEWWYWKDGEVCRPAVTDVYVPLVADTLELDRAVQVKISEAFGALIQGLKDGHGAWGRYFNDYIAEGECDRLRALGLLAFRRILHTSMGGRIPDEVP